MCMSHQLIQQGLLVLPLGVELPLLLLQQLQPPLLSALLLQQQQLLQLLLLTCLRGKERERLQNICSSTVLESTMLGPGVRHSENIQICDGFIAIMSSLVYNVCLSVSSR